ncbi:hypothetical protein DFJ43DRAFT_1178153 [Lentinula guzmanii]|uniref:Uncharacterized protein n=1 Tax=Lentinula guzmanii TaxID=2804957 RepID=A0AA38JU99_9AGAR|nr:hypothetical protein DFJ43DRAFT_1178153 [Lentinula guzmanii]
MDMLTLIIMGTSHKTEERGSVISILEVPRMNNICKTHNEESLKIALRPEGFGSMVGYIANGTNLYRAMTQKFHIPGMRRRVGVEIKVRVACDFEYKSMALSVSGLYSPSLEKNNSEFLGSNSTTPSPTSYKPPVELDFQPNLPESTERQTATASNNYPLYQQKILPLSELKSSKQVDSELTRGRRRGQSASARPTLRLHIANPTEPSLNQQDDVQAQVMRPTMQTAKTQTAQAFYPRSVIAAVKNDNQNRRRGETFSEFSRTLHPGSSAAGGTSLITENVSTDAGSEPAPAMVFHSGQLGIRTAPSSHMRITTSDLNFHRPNSSSPNSNSTPSSGDSVTNPTTKRPHRASPLTGPQAMMSATSGTNSSVSTAPLSIFSEESYPSASSVSASTVSTPATQESASEFISHFTSPRAPSGPTSVTGTRRPLPVPPPPPTIPPAMSSIIPSIIPSSPPVPPIPPPPPHIPTHSLTPSVMPVMPVYGHNLLQHGREHGRSSSGDLSFGSNANDNIAADLAYRMEKRRGKQRETAPNSPTLGAGMAEEEDIPYELRSDKWKGKQKMRDRNNGTPSVPQQIMSPDFANYTPTPPSNDANSFKSLEDREIGLPPSLSGTLSNQPSRASIESSHSSTRSIGGAGINERGVSKWKGKQILKTLSISSISSLERDSGGSLSKYAQLRGKGKEADSPASSFSSSPIVPLHSIPAPVPSPTPLNHTSHPNALIPGGYGGPRITSPRLMGDMSFDSRSTSPRTVAWFSTPPIPMYVEPPLPLNVRKVASPVISPNKPPMLPPKDYKHTREQSVTIDQAPMHTHPFDADDSDEEGRTLYKEVEAVYVSPTASSTSPEAVDRPVDTGYGYAEPGYEDDERVYIDDGFDDPSNLNSDNVLDDLDREYGLGVSASGQLVSGSGVGQSSSTFGHESVHGGFASSRISVARERSPSPMRYARRRRDSLPEDDYDSPESNGLQSPLEFADIPSPSSPQAGSRSRSPPVLEGFVYVDRHTSPRPLADTATQILNSLNSRRPLSPPPPSPSSSSLPAFGRSDVNERGRQSTRRQNNPPQILGDELGMSFAKNPSPTRYHPMKGVVQVGTLAVLAEEKVYVRGKWRMRTPSTGLSPLGGGSVASGVAISKTPIGNAQGGLRRYASEESLLSAVVPSEKDDDYPTGNSTGFAPLRSSGFNEFNLAAPNPSYNSKRFIDRAPTPDSFDSGSFNPNSSKKSLSSQGHGSGGGSSSGRHTPILRGPGIKPEYADDFGFGTGWKAALEYGRPARKSRGTQERDAELGRGRDRGIGGQDRTSRHQSTKLEKKRPVKRGKSLPRASGGGGEASEMKRSGTYVAHQRDARALLPSEHISYDLWVEKGLDQTSAAVKGKKTIPASRI